MRSRAVMVVVGAGLSLVLVAGCGGSSDKSSSDKTTTTTTPKFAGTGSESFCTALTAFTKQTGLLSQDPTATVEQRKAKWDQATTAMDSLAAASPREIKPDVVVVAKLYSSLRDALSKYGYDVDKLPESEQTALLSDSVKQSSARLTAYDDQFCGGSASSTTTT